MKIFHEHGVYTNEGAELADKFEQTLREWMKSHAALGYDIGELELLAIHQLGAASQHALNWLSLRNLPEKE